MEVCQLIVDGWSEDDSAARKEDTSGPATKKHKLSLSLNKKTEASQRFQFVDEAETEALANKFFPQKYGQHHKVDALQIQPLTTGDIVNLSPFEGCSNQYSYCGMDAKSY